MTTMSDEENQDVPMAECGACRTIIPLDSEECPSCGVKFGGVSDEALGECGACGALQPIDATSCSECGVVFVADDVIEILQNWLTATGIGIRSLFERFDTDNDGEISSEEFKEGLLSLRLADLPPSQIDRLVQMLDEDDSGTISLTELALTFGDDSPASERIEVEEELPSIDEANEILADEEEESDDSVVEEVEEEAEDLPSVDEANDILVEEDQEETEEETEDDAEEESEDAEPEEEAEDDAEEEAEDDAEEEAEDDAEEEAEDDAEEEAEDDSFLFTEEESLDEESEDEEEPEDDEFDSLDTNKDGVIDRDEFEAAKSDEKEFPTSSQKFIMGKFANDVVYPIAYFLMVAFIGLWVVNGMGLIVDGTGGTIVYEGHEMNGVMQESANWDICEEEIDNMPDPCSGTVSVGETYSCDPLIDPNKCANSYTIFSGENGASSMPASFNLDGILMMLLGAIGLGIVAFLHLSYAPALREKAKKQKKKKSRTSKGDESDDDDEDEDDDSDDDDSDDDDESDDDDDDDSDDDDESDDDDDDDDDDSDDDDDDDSDDDDDEEDDIDVGDWVGLEVDGEDYYGEIVEFDDDEGTVTIETEDGEEITGDQDDMFFDDEDEDDE